MPLYEYQCKKCDHQFEILVRSTDRAACPDCQSHDLEKLISVPVVGRPEPGPKSSGNFPLAGGCGRSACAMGRCQGGFPM